MVSVLPAVDLYQHAPSLEKQTEVPARKLSNVLLSHLKKSISVVISVHCI